MYVFETFAVRNRIGVSAIWRFCEAYGLTTDNYARAVLSCYLSKLTNVCISESWKVESAQLYSIETRWP